MPQFAIIRLERNFINGDDVEFSQISVKAKPISLIDGKPLTTEAESPELALAFAVRRYPHFRHILAVQEISAYEHQHANDASRVLGAAKARSPRA